MRQKYFIYYLFSLLYIHMPCTLHAYPKSLDVWVPPPPPLPVKSYIMIDAQTRQVLASQRKDQIIPSDMIEPLLTLYITSDLYHKQQLQWDTTITSHLQKNHSKNTFLRPKDSISLLNLVKSIIIFQAPGALQLLQKHLSTLHDPDAPILQDCAQSLHLEHTQLTQTPFTSTASDLAKLGVQLIEKAPEFKSIYTEPSYSIHNKIFFNTNSLLNKESSVIGMYASQSPGYGYSTVIYSHDKLQKLIIVIIGAKNQETRNLSATMLMDYANRFYKTISISDFPSETKLWGGASGKVSIQAPKYHNISIPSTVTHWSSTTHWNAPLIAPIEENDILGHIEIKNQNNDSLYRIPLLSGASIDRAPLIQYYWKIAILKISHIFGAQHHV